jgi:hypothetical protein
VACIVRVVRHGRIVPALHSVFILIVLAPWIVAALGLTEPDAVLTLVAPPFVFFRVLPQQTLLPTAVDPAFSLCQPNCVPLELVNRARAIGRAVLQLEEVRDLLLEREAAAVRTCA